MDARRGKLAAALAAASTCALGAAGTANAATVTAHPPQYVKPSAGPFTWTFGPSVAGTPVAWRLSTETAWHRCTTAGSATFATLPESRYSISVADDDPTCSPGDTTPPPTRATVPGRGDTTVVDGTPPVLPPPVVTRLQGNVFTIDASAASDALSPIVSTTWVPLAGATPRTGVSNGVIPRPRTFTSTYPPGTSIGSVTVIDAAGNSATQSFTVDASPLPDVTPPTLTILRMERGVLAGRALRVVLGVSERAAVRIAPTVRVAGRSYRLPEARRSLVGNRWITVRVPIKARVRRSIARAVRRHLPVRASVRVVAVDRAGHPAVPATSAVRITG